jgi:hypothetical protein
MIKLLLENKANVNVHNDDCLKRQFGISPYLLGIFQGCPGEILDLLKSHGANFDHVKRTY